MRRAKLATFRSAIRDRATISSAAPITVRRSLRSPKRLDVLRPLLQDASVLKIGQNIKYDALVMKRYGIDVTPFDDTMLISYALDGGRNAHGMDVLAERHLGHACMTFAQAMGQAPGAKKSEKTFAAMPLDKATEYAAEDADVTLQACGWL